MSEVSRIIKEYREKKGLSQGDVADHFGYSSPQFLSNTERGISSWPLNKAKELCELLGIPKAKFVWAVQKDGEKLIKKNIEALKKGLT